MEDESDLRQIRIWSYYAGILCPPYGEIPDRVLQYYLKAHRNAPIPLPELRQPPFLPPCQPPRSLIVRTDFSDDSAWREVTAAVRQPTSEGFEAIVDLCDDHDFAGLTPERLLGHLGEPDGGLQPRVLFIVDALTVQHAEHPLIAIDLAGDPAAAPGSWVRVIPSAVQSVADNMNQANMWFWEFVRRAGPDDIFRSF